MDNNLLDFLLHFDFIVIFLFIFKIIIILDIKIKDIYPKNGTNIGGTTVKVNFIFYFKYLKRFKVKAFLIQFTKRLNLFQN